MTALLSLATLPELHAIVPLLAQATNQPGNTDPGTPVVSYGGAFFVAIVVFVIITSLFWFWMLADCLLSRRPAMEKLVWFIVIFFLHFLGAFLYLFLGKRKRATETG